MSLSFSSIESFCLSELQRSGSDITSANVLFFFLSIFLGLTVILRFSDETKSETKEDWEAKWEQCGVTGE
jgi:hypothetical protein